jgi:hypothetical protein
MKTASFFLLPIITLGLALMAFSCKVPSQPPDETIIIPCGGRDTVQCTMSVQVNGVPWSVYQPFTSPYIIDTYQPSQVVAKDAPYIGRGAACFHNLNPNNNYFNAIFTRGDNLAAWSYYTSPDSVYLGKLYSWDKDELSIMFVAPSNVKPPFQLDSLRSFSFSQTRRKHQVDINRGLYRFQAQDSAVFFYEWYSAYWPWPQDDSLVKASLTLDEYDATRCRASGRFYIRLLSKVIKKDEFAYKRYALCSLPIYKQ